MKKISILIILLIITVEAVGVDMLKFSHDSNYKIGEFKGKVAKFLYLNKYGIISDSGEIVISPKFDNIKVLDISDRFLVEKSNRWGVIDKNGKIVIDYEYEDINLLKNKNYMVKKNNRWGVVNEKNKIEVPIKYNSIKSIGDRIFLIDSTGVDVMNGDLKRIKNYGGNNIEVLNEEGFIERIDGEIFYTYRDQKIKIDETVEQIYNNFLVIATDKKRHIKNLVVKNNDIEKYIFDGIFIQNLKNVIVEKNEKYGVYNIDMQEIVPMKFDRISGFYKNFYIYEKDYRCGLINSEGKMVLESLYNTIENIKGDLIIASKDTGVGIVNIFGKEIIPFIYDDIKFLGNQNFMLFNREKVVVRNRKDEILELGKDEIFSIYSNQINTVDKIYIFR